MPKNKKEPYIKENKKNLFFYEILGIVLALISFFALAKLGTLGFYINLTFKLIFGDWAFLFIILGIVSGCYFLIFHQKLPISSLRLIGIILIFTSFSILSHFSMHDYIKQYTTNYLPTSINLYFDYFKSTNAESMIGGGLFGMFLFYLLFYLISTPGVIIISIGMIILGFSFVSKTTLIDFSKLIAKLIVKIFNFIRNRNSKLKKFFEKVNQEYTNKKIKKLPKNLIKTKIIDNRIDQNTIDNYLHLIKVGLNRLNLFHYEVNSYQTPHLLVFTIKSLLKIDLERLEYQLVNELHMPFLMKINEDDNLILIEILNPNLRKISLFEALNYDNKDLFITIDDHNDPIYLNNDNKKILLFSNDYKPFLFYLILCLKQENKIINVISTSKELEIIKDYVSEYHQSFDYLDEIIVNIENQESKIINYCFIDLNIKNSKIDLIINKLKYLLQLSQNSNYYFIIRLNGYLENDLYFYDMFNYLYTIDNDQLEVIKLFGFNKTTGLSIKEEGLFKNSDLIMRVANCEIDEKELIKLKNKNDT